MVTNCDHLARLKFSRTRPYAFTEHGALMAATLLKHDDALRVIWREPQPLLSPPPAPPKRQIGFHQK